MAALGYTQVTATHMRDATGNLISDATATFTPHYPFRTGGNNGPTALTPVTTPVSSGALSIALADTSLTNPANITYSLSITDDETGEVLLAAGYGSLQPSGTSWSLDDYVPVNTPALGLITAGPEGPPGPAGPPGSGGGLSGSNIAQAAATAASVNPFTVMANQVVDANHALFTDGTDYWSAGPAYAAYGHYISDGTLTMLSNPAKFTAAQVLNILTKFMAARNSSGDIPISILPTGAASYFYSVWDGHQAHVTGDGWIFAPKLLYLYWKKTGDLAPYTVNIAGLKAALARIPRNSATTLLTVNAGDEYICGFGFSEYMRNTGDVANGNVFYASNMKILAEMASAAGDSANLSFFNSELSNTVAGIQAHLIDSSTGLLKAATGQNSGNLDVVASALAVFYELLTSAQEAAIASYFSSNYSTLVNAAGYVLQSPTSWAVVGSIPSGGGTPYGSSVFTGTQYQGGYWSVHLAWFAYTLAKASLAKVGTLLTAFLNGADPATEYYNQGSVAPQGTSPNLESPQAAKYAADTIGAPLTITAGPSFVNQYGAAVSPGGGKVTFALNSATSEVVDVQNTNAAGGSSIGFLTSDGAANSGVGYANPSFSLAALADKAYLFGTDGTVLSGNLSRNGGVGVGIDSFNNVTVPNGLFAESGAFRSAVAGLYGAGSGSGSLAIFSVNLQRDAEGNESLIDPTNPALRMALVLPSTVIIQTAAATTGVPGWTTVKTLN